MNLYYLSQDQNRGYDTYDAMVVAAESEQDARTIGPYGNIPRDDYNDDCWAHTPDHVDVRLLGEAKEGTERGIILSSFNAG